MPTGRMAHACINVAIQHDPLVLVHGVVCHFAECNADESLFPFACLRASSTDGGANENEHCHTPWCDRRAGVSSLSSRQLCVRPEGAGSRTVHCE